MALQASTVRDAFAEVIAEDRELMDIYLSGAPIDRLFDEVTCGDVGIKGAKVIVPVDRYGVILDRLRDFDSSTWDGRWQLYRFLSFRCDREFLSKYIERHPSFVGSLSVGSYLLVIPQVRLLVRLHDFQLLPEEDRARVVKAIRELAVETPDAGFLNEGVRRLLGPSEFESILEDVRTALLPHLESTIRDWRSNFRGSEGGDPESHFSDLVDALKEFREIFSDDSDAWKLIETALSDIDEVVEDLRQDQPMEPDSDDFRGSGSVSSSGEGDRSIFDDVDQ